MSQNNMPYTDGLGNYDRVQHAREEALWAPLSPGERRQWSQCLVDFRPDRETPMTNRMLDSMMGRYGVISLERWVEPLLAFDAAGFSAQDWLEIMTSLHVFLARQPELVLDNPAVTMLRTYHFTSCVSIQPESWLAWVPLRHSGKSAITATRAVLLAAKPTEEKAPRSSLRL